MDERQVLRLRDHGSVGLDLEGTHRNPVCNRRDTNGGGSSRGWCLDHAIAQPGEDQPPRQPEVVAIRRAMAPGTYFREEQLSFFGEPPCSQEVKQDEPVW